jgi:pteridine reductase
MEFSFRDGFFTVLDAGILASMSDAATLQGSALYGKTALVTGAAKRLGAQIVRQLHARGANVAVHYRDSAGIALELCAELNRERANSAIAVAADLLDTARLPTLIEQTLAHFRRLDILINNASSFFPTPLGQISEAAWNDLIGTNLKAPLFLAQAAAPHLRATHGLIVNLVDIHALRPLRDHPVYCAAKAGLLMLTRSLARELGPEVRVNGVAPGPVLWPEAGMDEALKQQIVAQTALKRAGSPEDIAKAVMFFATEAPFITGQILAVDGGRSIGW